MNKHNSLIFCYHMFFGFFSGLEILMACFDKPLSSEWHRVAKCIIQNSQLRGEF